MLYGVVMSEWHSEGTVAETIFPNLCQTNFLSSYNPMVYSSHFRTFCSTIFTGWVPTLLRAGRGMTMWSKAGAVPAEKLELFSFENNTVGTLLLACTCV
jgi:hypothetical protein